MSMNNMDMWWGMVYAGNSAFLGKSQALDVFCTKSRYSCSILLRNAHRCNYCVYIRQANSTVASSDTYCFLGGSSNFDDLPQFIHSYQSNISRLIFNKIIRLQFCFMNCECRHFILTFDARVFFVSLLWAVSICVIAVSKKVIKIG